MNRDFAKSIAADQSVSKEELFQFLEVQFCRADRNHDGRLDLDELSAFVNALVRPDGVNEPESAQ